MQSNTQTQTGTKQETKQENKPNTQIIRPKDWEINLLNRDDVSFEAISNVLAVVLGIAADQAMTICMRAHNQGKAPVFKGPRDMAEQYLLALNNAKVAQAIGKDPGMGYQNIEFEVIECE